MWEGDNRPGGAQQHVRRPCLTALPTGPEAWRLHFAPAYSARFWGDLVSALPWPSTAWAFLATPQMGPREGLGNYSGSGKRAAVGVQGRQERDWQGGAPPSGSFHPHKPPCSRSVPSLASA